MRRPTAKAVWCLEAARLEVLAVFVDGSPEATARLERAAERILRICRRRRRATATKARAMAIGARQSADRSLNQPRPKGARSRRHG
jgi:hypothetical protein